MMALKTCDLVPIKELLIRGLLSSKEASLMCERFVTVAQRPKESQVERLEEMCRMWREAERNDSMISAIFYKLIRGMTGMAIKDK